MNTKQTEQKQKEVRILNKPLSYAIDGHAVIIKSETNSEIVFFQIVNEQEKFVEMQGITSLRMDMNQLKKLAQVITDTVIEHEKKQK